MGLITHGKSDVVHYLVDKYGDKMSVVNYGCPYDLDEWEKVLYDYSYMTFGHDVQRKLGIQNQETDGLLMLVAVILEEVSGRRYEE